MSDEQMVDTDEVIVACLARGVSYAGVGRLAGVSARTVQRRVADREFSDRVAQARSARVSEITGRLGDLSLNALGVLDDAMAASEPMKHRLAAAGVNLRPFGQEARLEGRSCRSRGESAQVVTDQSWKDLRCPTSRHCVTTSSGPTGPDSWS